MIWGYPHSKKPPNGFILYDFVICHPPSEWSEVLLFLWDCRKLHEVPLFFGLGKIEKHELGNRWRAKIRDAFWSGRYEPFDCTTNWKVSATEKDVVHIIWKGDNTYLFRQVEKQSSVMCHIMSLSIYLKLSGKTLLQFYRIPVKNKDKCLSFHQWGYPQKRWIQLDGLFHGQSIEINGWWLGLRRPCSNVWALARQKWRSWGLRLGIGSRGSRYRNRTVKWGE